jgi:hypothetical protein
VPTPVTDLAVPTLETGPVVAALVIVREEVVLETGQAVVERVRDPVAAELAQDQAAAERVRAPEGADLALVQVVVRVGTKWVTAVRHRDLLLLVEEDLVVVAAETSLEPVAIEVVIAWAVEDSTVEAVAAEEGEAAVAVVVGDGDKQTQ